MKKRLFAIGLVLLAGIGPAGIADEPEIDAAQLRNVYYACCESFFRHMKRECINRKTFHNQDELRLCCFEYINRYNSKRPHSSLGDYTPDEIEDLYMERQA